MTLISGICLRKEPDMNEGVFVVHTQTVWWVICLKFETHKKSFFEIF